MRPSISSIIFIVAVAWSGSTVAQGLSCPQNLTWRDATYAQRTADLDGRVVKAVVESFSNIWMAQVDEGPDRYAIISVRGKARDSKIALTFGKDRPKPADFSEIGMAVESPMGDGNWSRMKRPCDIKDGSSMKFNERDMVADTVESTVKPPVFHGVLHRKGLGFRYSIAFAAYGTEPAFSLEGELKYGPSTKIFDMATDVQGWNLYRANTFVRAIPLGESVRLSTVLSEMGISTQ